MKYSIGFCPTLDFEEYKKYFTNINLAEVYFSYIGSISGHDMSVFVDEKCNSDMFLKFGGDKESVIEYLIENMFSVLRSFKLGGKKINLLLNASCYGKMEATVEQENYIEDLISKLSDRNLYPDIITTTSPYIANYLKTNHPSIEIRMSVLSCISSITSMEMTSNIFDSYYVNQDLNRNIRELTRMRKWCDENNKKLCIVVNSGCLGNCPYKMNHGNLSSHGYESISYNTYIPCMNIYGKTTKDKISTFLKGNWIRPEDIHNYDGLIDIAKLDTRLGETVSIADAYLNKKFNGNLYSIISKTVCQNIIVDNLKFPTDYFEHIKNCTKKCELCGYCDSISGLFKN